MANDRTPRTAEIINYALELFRAGFYVGRPVRVDAVDRAKGTVDVIPMLKDNYTDDSETVQHYDLPIIHALPIGFPEGNGFVDTWPIQKGDQGWILFSDRSLDQWQQLGNIGNPVNPLTEFRHSLSAKGLFIPGGRSVKEAITEWDAARRVIGKQGGPRIAMSDTLIHIGVAHGADGADFIALAQKVLDNLNDLKTHFTAIETVITGAPITEPGGGPSALQKALSSAIGLSPYPTPQSVAAQKVKAT